MMNERGFLQMTWVYAGVALLVTVLVAGVWVQSSRLDACKAEHAAFVAQVKALGEAAEREAKRKDAENRAKKEKADAAINHSRTELRRAEQRLRDERATRSIVSRVTAGTGGTGRVCVEPAEFERAIQRVDAAIRQLDTGVSDLIGKGDDARVVLDEVKRWSQQK